MSNKNTAYCDICCEQVALASTGKFITHKTVLDSGRFQKTRVCDRSNQKPRKK